MCGRCVSEAVILFGIGFVSVILSFIVRRLRSICAFLSSFSLWYPVCSGWDTIKIITNMKTLVRNYDSLFNELFNNAYSSSSVLSPSANIKETDNAYTIELAIPGFTKDDFKIEVRDRVLEVSSVSQSENEEQKESYIRKEFSYSSFSRSFRLPRTVDTDQISATYENGVLNLALPKKEEAKVKEPRLISVN